VAYSYESQFKAAAPQVEGILLGYLIIGHVLQIERKKERKKERERKKQRRGRTGETYGEKDT
jgi:hypothetical protein